MKLALHRLAALAVCGALAVLGRGAPAFASSPDAQFSGNGNYFARLSGTTVKVWNYTNWPAKALTRYDIKLDTAGAPGVKNWRIADDGAVWYTLPQGGLLYYPADPKDSNVSYNKFFTPENPAFKNVVFGQSKDQSVFFFSKTPGANNVTEYKCRLMPEIFSETGVERFCASRNAFPEPLAFPAERDSVICREYCIYNSNFSGLDYVISVKGGVGEAPQAYLYSVDGKQTVESAFSVLGKDYMSGLFGERYLSRTGYVADTYVGTSPSASSTLELWYVGGTLARTIEVPYGKGYVLYWDLSPDRRYVVLGVWAPDNSTSLAVIDLRHPDRAPRTVPVEVGEKHSMPRPQISPNGRFLLYGDETKPVLLAQLIDPDYDKPVDLKIDILMARITSALQGGRYADAVPLFEDIEDFGVDPGEDFYFYQADTLARAGLKAAAQKKVNAFVVRFGRQSSHYARMIEILAQ